MTLLSSFEGIFSIILIVALGYFLTKKGYFSENTADVFSVVVTNVSLPAYMIVNITSTFDKEKFLNLDQGLIIPFASMIACYGIGYLVAKAIRIPAHRRGLFKCMFFVSNTIFIGLPVNVALFGEISLPYILLYYFANTCLFWTVGVYDISCDGDKDKPKLLSLKSLEKTMTPPLIGFIIGVVLVFTGVKLPSFITSTLKYLGNLTTPLSMLFIGISMSGVNLRGIRVSKDMVAVILGRFVISPLLVFLLALWIPIPTLMMQVFIIQAAMPVMTNASIIARAYNADDKYAAVMVTLTTLLSMITIPIYMVIFQRLSGS